MAYIPKVDILINNLEYLEVKDFNKLAIKLNRIVDDLQQPNKKFYEHSFALTIPYTKVNNRIFGFKNEFDVDYKFKQTDYPIQIIVNSVKIIDGYIRVQSLGKDGYKCNIYSKALDLFDRFKDTKLTELAMTEIPWNYETTIRTYCNNSYSPITNTGTIQFPFIFYRTMYTPADTLAAAGWGLAGQESMICRPDYNLMLHFNNGNAWDNTQYYQAFPPAVFVVPALKQCFHDAGWGVSSKWMQDHITQRLIMPYVGDTSVWDIGNGLRDAGGGSLYLQPAKFLPDMKISEFVNGLINMFNLYMMVDPDKRVVYLEPFNTFFSDRTNGYDITDKIFDDTVENGPAEKRTVLIKYKDDEEHNKSILGLKRSTTAVEPLDGMISPFSEKFDRYSTIDNHGYADMETSNPDTEITLPFAATNMLKTLFFTYDPFLGSEANTYVAVEATVPIISKQTLKSNEDNCYNEDTGTTTVNNTPSVFDYDGSPRILIWHGASSSDFKVRYLTGGSGSESIPDVERENYLWLNVGWPISGVKTRIQFASFTGYPDSGTTHQAVNRAITYADYSGSTLSYDIDDVFNSHYATEMEQTLGENRGTPYSLSLNENRSYFMTLYDYFHKAKWDQFRTSEVIDAEMRMDERDWLEMRINRPLIYRGQLFRLMKIEGYNPITQTAKISMIRYTHGSGNIQS